MKLDSDERDLADFRALRDEAWALLKEDIAALHDDIEQRGLGARLADRVGDEAREVWEQTLEVADAHRGVVAATLMALVGWFLRGPIVHGMGALFGDDKDDRDSDRAPQSGKGDGT